MTINKTTKKGVRIKFTALLIAGLLTLAAIICISAPKATKASADTSFNGSISIYGVKDYNNVKCLNVNIPSEQYFGQDYPWSCSGTVITAVTTDNGGANYSKTFDRAPLSENIPLSEIGAFSVYGNYTITAEATYSYQGDGTNHVTYASYAYNYEKIVIALPETPTKEGYSFTGWFLDEACTTPYLGQEITEAMTFYAGWTINRYTITFDSAGGSIVDTQTIDWNTAATTTTPTREGYTFLGWFNGETKYEGSAIKENTTLTANWQIKTYTVTFMVDGVMYKTFTVEHGTTLEQAMEAAKMSYFNLMADGVKDGKSGIVTGDITAEAAAMTNKEKTATFLSSNMWILWTLCGCTLLLVVTFVVLIVKKKRG